MPANIAYPPPPYDVWQCAIIERDLVYGGKNPLFSAAGWRVNDVLTATTWNVLWPLILDYEREERLRCEACVQYVVIGPTPADSIPMFWNINNACVVNSVTNLVDEEATSPYFPTPQEMIQLRETLAACRPDSRLHFYTL